MKIDQETAVERLALLGRASTPIYYTDGIVAARLGYYQLGRMPDGKRALRFGLDLEDMQKVCNPDGTFGFAHQERLGGVGVYDKNVSSGRIYADMIMHQEMFRDTIHQEGTLVRTAPGTYQSRHVSFLEVPDKADPEKVRIHAFVTALPSTDFVPVSRSAGSAKHMFGDASFHLTREKAIGREEALPFILDHFTQLQIGLTHGVSAADSETRSLSRPARTLFRTLFGMVGMVDRLGRNTIGQFTDAVEEMRHKNVQPMYDFVQKGVSYISLRTALKSGIAKLALPLVEAAFNFGNDVKSNRRKLPNGLGRHALPQAVETPLNKYLVPLRPESTKGMVPLCAREAQLLPLNYNARDTDPFDAERFDHIGWNSIRSAFGGTLLVYDKTSLILQPNGLWIAALYDKNGDERVRGHTIVGYNPKLDTGTKPAPLPQVAAYLKAGHVIRYTHDGDGEQSYTSELVPLADMRKPLAEIHAANDGYLLVAEKPKVSPMSQIVERAAPVKPAAAAVATAPMTLGAIVARPAAGKAEQLANGK